jgi:hypothetical protein
MSNAKEKKGNVTKADQKINDNGSQEAPQVQKPSIGRIVTMKTTESQRAEMNAHGIIRKELPAIIVSTDEAAGTANLKVFTDGEKDIWMRDVKQGKEEGTWNWPTKK